MPELDPDAANPIHCGGSSRRVAWTTINAGEAIPGVVTPLTWSFFGTRTEQGTRGAFCDLGALRPEEIRRPRRPEDRLWDVFYGRAAANLNVFRAIADRIPGTSGDALEAQLFGQSRDDVHSTAVRSRYPVVALKAPLGMARVVGRLDAAAGDIGPWWQATVRPGAIPDAGAARRELTRAAERFEHVMRPHTFAAFLCQGLYEQVRALAARAGRPGLEITLVTGYGDMAETAYVAELWDVARGDGDLTAFLARHGYHGPNEGELEARVWRLDPRPLTQLVERYRSLDAEHDPRRMEARRAAERRAAEQEVLAATPRSRRGAARLVLRLAERFIPLRGTGKAAFLQCVDVARAAALVLGEDLAARGVLEDPRDVYHLTLEELLTPGMPVGAELVAERRALRDLYKRTELPEFWEGSPEALTPSVADAGDGAIVTGIPVSPGVVEGIARVVRDPEEDDGPDEGEVLVCRTTDPSWASVLVVAAAMVIDIGGPISHGAIVAREMGVPCVIGTRTGTETIRSGDRVRVDGASGEVVVLERAAA